MRTLIASLFVVLVVGCTESISVGEKRVFVSESDMPRSQADEWCESRGGVVADMDDPDLVIDACDTPDVGYGWCWIDLPESGAFVLALDGSVYGVEGDFTAPVACATFD